jgi:uncharacterized membrane protein
MAGHQRAEQKRAANARSRNAPRVLRFRDVCHAGLSRTDNQVFVDAMQRINVAILNPWLAFILAGPPVFGIVTAVLHFQAGQRATVGWIGAALVLYVVALPITVGINVPLNDTRLRPGQAPTAVVSRPRTQAGMWMTAPRLILWTLMVVIITSVGWAVGLYLF